jgi:hypothetical protein
MTEADIADVLARTEAGWGGVVRARVDLPVPVLAATIERVAYEPGQGMTPAIAASAIARLTALPQAMRAQIAARLFQAAEASFAECADDFDSPQAQLDYEKDSTGRYPDASVPRGPADIWSLVTAGSLLVRMGPTRRVPVPGPLVVLSFNVAWDGEHGAAVFLAGGERIVHVGDVND